jgi:hypothetical protein
MHVEIKNFNPLKKEWIQTAADGEWEFEGWWEDPNNGAFMSATGDDVLTGGEGDDEFAQRLSMAVWKANGGFCKVMVVSTYMENLPCEAFELTEEDCKKLCEEDGACPAPQS